MNRIKKIGSFLLALTMMLSLCVCFAADEAASAVKFEAENGALYGSLAIRNSIEGFSGTGYVGQFSSDSSYLEIPFVVSEDGRYNITVRNNSQGHYKENPCYIDGQAIGTLYSLETKEWQDGVFESIKLTKGKHTFTVKKSWGYIYVDYIAVLKGEGISNDVYNITYPLSNPNANDDAKRLWQYLCDNYGENIISGQYTDKGQYSNEYKAIVEATGEAPAIWGFDMMDYSPSRVRYGTKPTCVDTAIEWAKDYGGIVTFCWHWTPNEKYLYGNESGLEWWRGFYTYATTFDFKAAMNGEDEEGYNYILEDIDAIALQLKRLQDEGIPVLWRPLHEASGGWFWWGTDKDSYLKLWDLLYDRLTNYHGLNNLIWVWNGQNPDWYPGDETVDIIGEDIYPDKHDNSSQMARFLKAKKYTSPEKMICLSENGSLPDIDNCIEDNVMWSWFATWGGEFIQKSGSLNGAYTPIDTIKKIYQSENVITLSEVPDLSTYPLTSEYEPSEETTGDINGDEVLDIVDVVMARSHIVGNTRLTAEQIIVADFDKDSEITVVDVVYMRKIIVGSI